jgi:AcrR family transcriptional regulator
VETRPPGRPRDPAATDTILQAAAEVLAESGADGFTIRAVVARSGASSATVYRRWPSKPALLLDTAMQIMGAAIPEPPHESLADDLRVIVGGLVRLLERGPVAAALPEVIRSAGRSDAVRVALSRSMAARRVVVERALRIAVERGEARADLPVEHGAELLSGPIYYRFVVADEPIDAAFVDRHVRELLRWAVG